MEIEPGIILVDKPKGITSFDVIRRLRKELSIRKMGHAGTLDPNATGLMIIALEGATKKLAGYIKLPKCYEAEILFGLKTDTGDTDGAAIEDVKIVDIPAPDIEKILADIEKEKILNIKVPAYSAIKQNGKSLYELARKGVAVDAPIKAMEVTSAKFLSVRHENGKTYASVSFNVGSGAYIRSIAEEIGRRLGVPATLSNLRRTSIAEYKVEDARKI